MILIIYYVCSCCFKDRKKILLFYYLEYFLMNLFEFKYSVKMINGIGKNINGLINCKYLNGFVIM